MHTNQIVLLIILSVFPSIIADSFYAEFPDACLSHTIYERECNVYGKHLVSIHSKSQNEEVMNICQCDTCWIGMEVNAANNMITMNWIDDTRIVSSLINQSWCLGYPIIDYNNTMDISYYIFIDTSDNCWKSTRNSSINMCGICGPQMFDTTGLYWIANCYIPLISAFIALPYSIYCLLYLSYHLCIFEHNWLLYPSKYTKVTAVLMPCMMTIIFILGIADSILLRSAYHSTKIMAPSSPFDSDYPYIYSQYAVILSTTIALYYCYIPIGYIHVLLRLKHEMNNNEFMRNVQICCMSWKCCYWVIIVLIFIYFMTLPMYEIVNVTLSIANSNNWEFTIKIIIIGIGLSADILINSMLLILYIKGLYKYARGQYFRYDTAKENQNKNTMDSRQHELMIEATRYTVLFSMVSILNIVGLIVIVGLYYFRTDYFDHIDHIGNKFQSIFTMTRLLGLFLKEIILLIAISLSFKFSHERYEKLCKRCDQWIKDCCHQLIRKENAEIMRKIDVTRNINALQQPLLPSDLELN